MKADFPKPGLAPVASPRSSAQPALSMRTVGNMQKKLQVPSQSLYFLSALNDCISATALPHPVTARNVGLVPSWQRWSSWLEGASDNSSVADRIVTNPRNNFDKCVDVVKDELRNDSVWTKGVVAVQTEEELDTSGVFAAAPLMFWRRPRALVELTNPLQQLLDRSDLGDDIPVGLLRPPVPACYIRFGDDMQHAILSAQTEDFHHMRVEGVYVFESVREEQRAVALVAIWAVDGQPTFSVSTIEMIIGDDKEPLVDVIERTCANKPGPVRLHHRVLAQLCTKVFLYWSVEQARTEEQRPYFDAMQQLKRLGPKKAAKLQRHVDRLYDRVLLGPLSIPGHGAHDEVSPHWRRGHFRMQPHGPHHSLRKVLFIAPTLVRADRLENAAPDGAHE